jgi:flagellar hook-associated protein 1 FlgK
MGNLFTALRNTASSMGVFERAMGVVQNNVANIDTPGYAKQVLSLSAKPFDPNTGLSGGVQSGDLVSYRSVYAEESVRQQNQEYGRASQKAQALANVEPVFTIAQNSGISAALSGFFSSVSSLSVAPNDASARQVVIDRASQLARSFNQTAASLAAESRHSQSQLASTVNSINAIASTIRDINYQRRQNYELVHDARLDAQLNTALEDLSEQVDFTTLYQPDGSVTVLLGGQTPLVLGDKMHPISVDTSGASVRVLSESGQDITGQVSSGRLSAVLDVTKRLLPGYADQLGRIAAAVGTAVNDALRNGWDSTGNPPTVDLFSFDSSDPAGTLSVNALRPGDLAVALPNAAGGNGNALLLAKVGDSPILDGYNATQAYGVLAGSVGRELSDAKSNESVQELLVSQARSMRSQQSSVSLDEEAAKLLEFQRSYQAASKMFSVINEMTDSVMNLIR